MSDYVVELKHVTKKFPGVVAMRDMHIAIRPGEIHGLIGENGAGKSTLIMVLTGVYVPEEGEIYVDGKRVSFSNPVQAREQGITCVYQELNIVPMLSVVDNVFMGRRVVNSMGLLDYPRMHREAKEALAMLGQEDIDTRKECGKLGVNVVLSEVWGKGGPGGATLATEVLKLVETPSECKFIYDVNQPLKEKINAIATKIYGADGVDYIGNSSKEIADIEALGYGAMPICMAKTQYSLSDNAAKLGRPQNFRISIRNVKISAGAGFLVALTGEIMTMPGLPKVPAAETIDVDNTGKISGLF